MLSAFIKFRGQDDVEVLYHDYGYECDTNSQIIEWHFADNTITKDQPLSETEEQEIYEHLSKLGE